MADQARTLMEQNVPWRRGIGWGVVAAQGALLAAVGLFLLLAPNSGANVVRQTLAGILVVVAAAQAVAAFRRAGHPAAPFHALRGGVGVAIGLVGLIEPLVPGFTPGAARFILGLGWLAYGIVGLATVAATREEEGLRFGALISGAVAAVLGILLLTGDESGAGRIALLGWVALLGGALLLAYAMFLRQRSAAAAPAAA